jgi:hypothetical protein
MEGILPRSVVASEDSPSHLSTDLIAVKRSLCSAAHKILFPAEHKLPDAPCTCKLWQVRVMPSCIHRGTGERSRGALEHTSPTG